MSRSLAATTSNVMMGHFRLSESKTAIRLSCPCPPVPRPRGPRCSTSTLHGLSAFVIRSPNPLLCSSRAAILNLRDLLQHDPPYPFLGTRESMGLPWPKDPSSGFCAPCFPPSNSWPPAGRDVSRLRLEHPVPSASSCCWPQPSFPFLLALRKYLGWGCG